MWEALARLGRALGEHFNLQSEQSLKGINDENRNLLNTDLETANTVKNRNELDKLANDLYDTHNDFYDPNNSKLDFVSNSILEHLTDHPQYDLENKLHNSLNEKLTNGLVNRRIEDELAMDAGQEPSTTSEPEPSTTSEPEPIKLTDNLTAVPEKTVEETQNTTSTPEDYKVSSFEDTELDPDYDMDVEEFYDANGRYGTPEEVQAWIDDQGGGTWMERALNRTKEPQPIENGEPTPDSTTTPTPETKPAKPARNYDEPFSDNWQPPNELEQKYYDTFGEYPTEEELQKFKDAGVITDQGTPATPPQDDTPPWETPSSSDKNLVETLTGEENTGPLTDEEVGELTPLQQQQYKMIVETHPNAGENMEATVSNRFASAGRTEQVPVDTGVPDAPPAVEDKVVIPENITNLIEELKKIDTQIQDQRFNNLLHPSPEAEQEIRSIINKQQDTIKEITALTNEELIPKSVNAIDKTFDNMRGMQLIGFKSRFFDMIQNRSIQNTQKLSKMIANAMNKDANFQIGKGNIKAEMSNIKDAFRNDKGNFSASPATIGFGLTKASDIAGGREQQVSSHLMQWADDTLKNMGAENPTPEEIAHMLQIAPASVMRNAQILTDMDFHNYTWKRGLELLNSEKWGLSGTQAEALRSRTFKDFENTLGLRGNQEKDRVEKFTGTMLNTLRTNAMKDPSLKNLASYTSAKLASNLFFMFGRATRRYITGTLEDFGRPIFSAMSTKDPALRTKAVTDALTNGIRLGAIPLLAMSGVVQLHGSYPQDKDEQESWREHNILANSIQVGDLQIPFRQFSNEEGALNLYTFLSEASQGKLAEGFNTLLEFTGEGSQVMSQLEKYSQQTRYGKHKSAEAFVNVIAQDLIDKIIPPGMRELRRNFDQNRRQVVGKNDTSLQSDAKYFLNQIPGLSNTLPLNEKNTNLYAGREGALPTAQNAQLGQAYVVNPKEPETPEMPENPTAPAGDNVPMFQEDQMQVYLDELGKDWKSLKPENMKSSDWNKQVADHKKQINGLINDYIVTQYKQGNYEPALSYYRNSGANKGLNGKDALATIFGTGGSENSKKLKQMEFYQMWNVSHSEQDPAYQGAGLEIGQSRHHNNLDFTEQETIRKKIEGYAKTMTVAQARAIAQNGTQEQKDILRDVLQYSQDYSAYTGQKDRFASLYDRDKYIPPTQDEVREKYEPHNVPYVRDTYMAGDDRNIDKRGVAIPMDDLLSMIYQKGGRKGGRRGGGGGGSREASEQRIAVDASGEKMPNPYSYYNDLSQRIGQPIYPTLTNIGNEPIRINEVDNLRKAQ